MFIQANALIISHSVLQYYTAEQVIQKDNTSKIINNYIAKTVTDVVKP